QRSAAKITAGNVDAADAGGPGGLKAQIKSGKRVDLDARARRIAGAVSHRVEIKLNVGARRGRIRAQKAAELIHAERQRPALRQQVAQAGAQFSKSRVQLIVQR